VRTLETAGSVSSLDRTRSNPGFFDSRRSTDAIFPVSRDLGREKLRMFQMKSLLFGVFSPAGAEETRAIQRKTI